MGQQQLLLLVLGAIIVGLAVVVGLNLFSGSSLKANEDAVRQDCLTIASRCQEWYRKPVVLGGGGKTWTNLDFLAIGYNKELDPATGNYIDVLTGDDEIYNENGMYTLDVASGVVTITGALAETDYNQEVTYTVSLDTNGRLIVTKTS